MMSSPEPRPAIRFDRIDQIKPTPLAPVVHDYIFGDTVTGLIGASGACKSFVAGHLACSVGTNTPWFGQGVTQGAVFYLAGEGRRSEEHTSELQSLMRISYAVFCLKKKKIYKKEKK